MIQHIVMWNFKDNAQDNTKEKNIAIVKERLEALTSIVPGLVSLCVKADVAINEGNYDAVLISKFDDYEALGKYTVHPAHRKVSDFVQLVTQGRACVDYEITE